MKRQFIPDKEKPLSKDNDYLKTGVYASTLTKLINNTPRGEVFTIGLFGNWGVGKSSIVETAKENFEQSKVKFITYDAWKYANDSFRRMFLLKVQESLRLEQTPLMERFYQSENAEVKQKHIFTLGGIKGLVILAVAIVIIVSILPEKWVDWNAKAPIISFVSLLTLLISIFNGFFYNLKISVNKPALFAPEQFEDCFKQMIDISLKKESRIISVCKRVIEFVRRGETSITNLDKIVIIIDNIDRCHNAMAYQLLTDIKTFLSNEESNIVFVIPVDDEGLKKHLFESYHSTDCDKDKEEFLRKFFNVTLRIKPHRPTEMLSFAHELNEKYSLEFNNDTLSLVAKEFATNPRRIIQLLNNLSSELTLYDDEFAKKNESQICALLIIREEFDGFYRKTLGDMRLLWSDYDKELKMDDKNALSFMRIANVYFRNTTRDAILRILTNTSSLYTSLPVEFCEAVRTFNVKNIVEFVSTNKVLKKDILGFIIHSLKIDSQYGSEAQLTNWLDFIAEFNSSFSFDKSHLNELNNAFTGRYDKILPLTKSVDKICLYGRLLKEAHLPELKAAIISFISVDYKDGVKPPANHNSYVKSVLEIFNDESDSRKLSGFVDKYYADKWIDQKIDYSDAQKRFLFSDSHICHWIGKIKSIEDEDIIDEIMWLFSIKSNISNETCGAFFTHADSLLGEMKNKPKEEILSHIKFLALFLSQIGNGKLTNEPASIYTKLFAPRNISISRPGYTPSSKSVKLLDEYKGDNEALEIILNFCFEIYRITNNKTETKEQLKNIYPQIIELANKKCVVLLGQNYTLTPIFDVILSDNGFSEDNLILTEHCLTHHDKGGKRFIDDSATSNKIKSLIENISNNQVAELIGRVIADDTIKDVVIGEITSRDSAFINSLPQSLLDLAVTAFNKETSLSYVNNYTYMGIVAEKGTAAQKTEIVRILHPNILNNKDVDETLGVFELLNIGNKNDKNILVAQFEKYLESNPDIESEQKARVEALIENFKVNLIQ